MKQIIRFAVSYPVTIAMMVLAVILLGAISFGRLGMDLFPDLNNPRLFVEITSGERSPEEMESRFVEAIEAQAIRQQNAVNVSSVSRVGSALITVEYAWNTDMDEAFLDLQKALNSFSTNSEIDEMTFSQYDPNAEPIILLGFSHPEITDMDELRRVAESYLRNEFIRLEGIADVDVLGEEVKEVHVDTNSYLLEAFGLTTSQIASRIDEYNRNISGGSIVEMGTRYVVKGVSGYSSLEDIKDIVVTYREDTGTTTAAGTPMSVPVTLAEVADVTFANDEPVNIVRLNDRRCVGLAIYKETKYNTISAVDQFMSSLDTVRRALPGYELTVIQNQASFISTAVEEVEQTALLGVLLALIVLFVFLRRIGTTLVVSLAIPISIMATFNLMYFQGLTLNVMTLGGLALGAGMLVDNAIVVMENIFRHLEAGDSLIDAVILGTSEMSGAITASTITTIIVFLPIVYLQGSAGELFRDQALTVAFALISSLAVALLVIPMLSSYILRSKSLIAVRREDAGYAWYGRLLGGLLRYRWIILLVAAVMVYGAYRLIPVVGSEFLPQTDLNEFTVELRLPAGTQLGRTDRTVAGIESGIRQAFGDDLAAVFGIIGPSTELSGADRSFYQDENTALIKVIFRPDRRLPSEAIFAALDEVVSPVPDLEARLIQEQTALQVTMGDEAAPIVVEIEGGDLEMLRELTDQVGTRLAELPDLFNIESSFDEGRPEIAIVLDKRRAGFFDVSVTDVVNQLSYLFSGTEASEWDTGSSLTDIMIQLPEPSLGEIPNLAISGTNSEVRLHEIADITVTESPGEIYRTNQTRVGRVTADIASDVPLDRVVAGIDAALADMAFPPDYRYSIGGEEQERQEAFSTLRFALLLSLVLVYMVLASQFESLVHPFTIILTIPLALSGAIFIFLIAGESLNIMAFIGIIMLAGIAVNDAIILVDTILRLDRGGLPRTEAIIAAGRRRIRPIIMTSLTTILALLPLTFGFGEGASLRAPMALAVIGGLVTSTILTLVVIPCAYMVIDGIFGGRKRA